MEARGHAAHEQGLKFQRLWRWKQTRSEAAGVARTDSWPQFQLCETHAAPAYHAHVPTSLRSRELSSRVLVSEALVGLYRALSLNRAELNKDEKSTSL